ncbi:MAG: DUF924 domain-containing protein [Thiotrichales bacterium]|nr:DUF924 domain-containing protein [Thiotrichales bacterium]
MQELSSESESLKVADELITYWFSNKMKAAWFNSTPEIDCEIRERYEGLWLAAKNGALKPWLQSEQACLALIILLDQLPLNMFRGKPESFATEEMAVETTYKTIERGFDTLLSPEQRGFVYMPLMHSECMVDQAESVRLFELLGNEGSLRFARHHRDLIERFGRFPHRNMILNRESTPEEIAYLNSKEAFTG